MNEKEKEKKLQTNTRADLYTMWIKHALMKYNYTSSTTSLDVFKTVYGLAKT